jgi:hypothetical protein
MNLALRNSTLPNYRFYAGTFTAGRPGRSRTVPTLRPNWTPQSYVSAHSAAVRAPAGVAVPIRLAPTLPGLVRSPQPIKLRKVAVQPRRISGGKVGAIAIAMVVISFLAQLFISTVSAQLSFDRVEVEQKISLLTQDLQQVELNIARNQANIATLVKKYGLGYAQSYLAIQLGG